MEAEYLFRLCDENKREKNGHYHDSCEDQKSEKVNLPYHAFPRDVISIDRRDSVYYLAPLMITTQPHSIFAYIDHEKSAPSSPAGIRALHYLSWEDAMWDVIAQKKLPTGSVALVPSFWCGDVVQNMHAHGVECVHYPADQNFQTEEHVLLDFIRVHKPAMVIIFHAVGIRNRLLAENLNWIEELHRDTLLIEDSVHSVVDPSTVTLRRNNHFVIDSWRKVVPLQGAALYGAMSSVDWDEPVWHQSYIAKVTVFMWWIIFQIILHVQSLSSGTFGRYMGVLAERTMKVGYDQIGDTVLPAGTFDICTYVHTKLAYARIDQIKQKQVNIYEAGLAPVLSRNGVETVWYRDSDRQAMRGYPLRLSLVRAPQILARLREAGLIVRFELNDSPWSAEHKVIFLPLGPHLQTSDIESVVACVNHAVSDVL